MNCISDGNIQRYIDGEIPRDAAAYVIKHIATCHSCAIKIEQQRKLADGFKRIMSYTIPESTYQLPAFRLNTAAQMKPVYSMKRLFMELSAAFLVVLIIIFAQKKHTEIGIRTIQNIPSAGREIDANRPITDQPMVITIIDAEGNITEYID